MPNGFRPIAAALFAALGASACVSTGNPTAQLHTDAGLSPTINHSPMDAAMDCMSRVTGQPGRPPMRIAVGQIKDYTGKFSNEASEGGYKITQGASLMVISALGKLKGIDQVERFDTIIADQEATLAKAQLLRDPDPVRGQVVRPLTAGMYDGSDYYIVGGVTEANYTLSAGGAELSISQVGAGSRYYVMNVAADLRLVETKSLHVIKTVSVQKQIVGREVKAGVFNFLGDYLVDLNTGRKENEPMQMGVRTTLELGTLELLSPLYNNYFNACRPLAEAGFGWPKPPTKPKPAKTAKADDAPHAVETAGATPAAKAAPAKPATATPASQALPAKPAGGGSASIVIAAPETLTSIEAPPQVTPVSAPSQPLEPNETNGHDFAAAPVAAAGPAGGGRYLAQVGAVPTERDAGQIRRQLEQAYPDSLADRALKIQAVDLKGGRIFRTLVDGFPTRDSAAAFCRELAADKRPCFVRD